MHIGTHSSMAPSIQVIPPDHILRALLQADVDDCECHAQPPSQTEAAQEFHSLEKVQACIEGLHHTLDAMNHEVVEVENLLTHRDVLYHQLDHLRAQRQQIEDQADAQEATFQRTVKVKASRGLREMNERLRRRIKEVQEYIEKMDSENFKIEQSMSMSNSGYPSCPRRNFHTYTQYRGPSCSGWMDRVTTQPKAQEHFNRNYFDDFRRRLQAKQEQAWERVRRQEEEIDTRNARSLINFHKTGIRPTYLSPKYRVG